jgi:hypothetical protein
MGTVYTTIRVTGFSGQVRFATKPIRRSSQLRLLESITYAGPAQALGYYMFTR